MSLLMLATATSVSGLCVVVYALLSGMFEGAEKFLVSALATDTDCGTVFGWSTMIGGLGAIPAGTPFGLTWQHARAGTAFAAFGGVAIASAVFSHTVVLTPGRPLGAS